MARPGRKKRTALFIVEIICLLLFIGGLYVYGQIDSRLNKIETPQLDESKIVTNVTAPQMSGYTTYALFGIDQRSKNAALDAQNSDTIIIASINNDTKEVKLASVYRDTLLDIGNDTYTKANAAYAYGGPEQAISMLNTMLDLKITDYVTVNFNAMVAAIDALGGLDIPLSYAEMVFMNDYCRNFPGDRQKLHASRTAGSQAGERGGNPWNIPSEWCTVSFLLSYPLHCKHGYGTY